MEDPKVLTTQFETAMAEHKAILAKGEELTQEDGLKAGQLIETMRGLRGKIESFQRVEAVGRLRSAGEDLEAWGRASAGSPLQNVPALQALNGLGSYLNGVSVIGMEQDGEMVFGSEEFLNLDKEGKISSSAFGRGAFAAAATSEYKSAWRKNISKGWGNLTGSEQAILQEGLDTAGGYLSPDEMMTRVIQRKPTPTRIAGRVTQVTTSRDALAYPKVNYSTDDLYTTGIRATWTGEIPASSTAHAVTDPVFGQVRIPIFTAMLSIPVTNDLIEDSMFDLMGWLSGKFAETIDLLKDNMILNGTGVSQPMGILANPGGTNQPGTVVTGSAAALTGDGLINLTESLPEQYDENAVLVFNKTNTGKAIRLLKDGDGRPLVSYGAGDFGLASGRYKEVNGYPYIWSGFMPNVGANAYPIIFGDLQGYILANRVGFSVQVLRELLAQTNQVLLLGRVRFGGLAAEEWRLKVQKCST